MKRINILIILLLMWGCNQAQSKRELIIKNFVDDLTSNTVSNEELIRSYFDFKDIEKNKIEGIVIPILSKQLDLLKQKLIDDCSSLKIISHDSNLNDIKSYKLETEKLDESSVFYLTCNNEIVTPFLVRGNKFLSISTYSKTENGDKKFIIY